MKVRFLSAFLLCFIACGRYVKPVPPEALAPEAVKDFQAVFAADGVSFNWKSSERDSRGKPLQSLEEYRIYRKELNLEDSSIFSREGYFLISTLGDKHLPLLLKLQMEARKDGKSPRNVQVPKDLLLFTFKDTGLIPGITYSYRIIGVNQNGVESDSDRVVKVLFNGNDSELIVIR
ncbi:MAG: hypothetical protein SGJ02_14090 [bacterium]|nr:hypothetical protein [bacterium]